MRSFCQIGCATGTDKCRTHSYHIPYEKHFGSFRNEPVVLLEIGVLGGASLRLWEEYFPNGRFVGVDYDPACKKLESDRSKVYIGDQKDTAFLLGIVQKEGPFDIVIDDGSHLMVDQKTSFHALFPSILVGGCYVIEDLESSYYRSYGGGAPGSQGTTIEMIKGIIDDINFEYHKNTLAGPSGISEIHSYRNICFIVRGS